MSYMAAINCNTVFSQHYQSLILILSNRKRQNPVLEHTFFHKMQLVYFEVFVEK